MCLQTQGSNKNITTNSSIKVISIILASFIFLIAIASVGIHFQQDKVKKQEAQKLDNAVANVEKKGYHVQAVDGKKFYIEKDGVKYYFTPDSDGVKLYYCEYPVEEENVKVKEGEVLIKIYCKDDDTVSVAYHDMRVIIQDDGTEEGMYCGGYFICNKDFEESSIEGSAIIDGYQKALDAYTWIKKFTTLEELKEQYNKALAICEQLNAT